MVANDRPVSCGSGSACAREKSMFLGRWQCVWVSAIAGGGKI